MEHLIINKAFSMITGLLFSLIACAQTAENRQETDLPVYDGYDMEALSEYLSTGYCRNEVSLWTAGGVSSFQYRPVTGSTVNGLGGMLGVGYTRFFNKNWGLSSGLEYAFYHGEYGIDGVSKAYETVDMLDNPIIYTTRIDNYSEKLHAAMLQIPLSVLYQTGGKQRFYASAGLKLGLPVTARYSGSSSVLTASGYYPDYDQREIWQNDLGYGVFHLNGKKGIPELGMALMGTFETGVKWNAGVVNDLYTGVFVDCGFNGILKKEFSQQPLVEYNRNEPSQPLMNSACVPAERFSPMAFGLKVKMSFSVGCRDLLNARRSYKKLKSLNNRDEGEYYENSAAGEREDTEKAHPPAIPVETVINELPEERQSADSTATQEREAYLEAASERRRMYNRSMNVPDYDLGVVSLTVEQESALDDCYLLMEDNPLLTLNITGHTCDLGTDELNMRIGQERADLAKDYLVEKGIAPSRIQTFSKGKQEPLFPNLTEESRKKNRRLEIIFME